MPLYPGNLTISRWNHNIVHPVGAAVDTMGSWSASSIPSRETKTYAAWSVWWAKWHPYWVWNSTGKNTGYWVDDGWYDYFRDNYSASMTATTRIEPDEKVPTASGDLMKSGYGVTNTVTATVSTSAPLSHYTYGQTAVSILLFFTDCPVRYANHHRGSR